MNIRWDYNRIESWAVIAGVTTPVTRIQLDFELNAIPRAVLLLPVGREGLTGAPSPAHGLVGTIREMQPAQVYLRVARASGGPVRSRGLEPGTYRVFDGYTSGAGYARGPGGVQFLVGLNHWLVRLNESSALSKASHPANPNWFTAGALTQNDDAGIRNLSSNTEAEEFLEEGNLRDDLWGAAFYPWYRSLCERDGFLALDVNLAGSGKNDAALAALERMKPGGKFYRPLALDIDVDEDVALAISQSISQDTLAPGAFAHTTIWDCIVGKFAPDFCYAVVPRVEDALVVPYVSGYRGPGGKAFAEIRASEYAALELNAAHPRPLRAYGVLSGIQSFTGANLFDGPVGAADLGIGGLFDTEKDGTIIIGNGPAWMTTLQAPIRFGAAASGGDGAAIGSAVHPGEGRAPAGPEPGEKARAVKSALDKYARARFADEVLRHRQGQLSGALRFDVAPGSVVAVEGASELFLGAADALGAPFFAEVLRTSIAIDAEGQQAGTAFHLARIRTLRENRSDETSVARHPLYTNTFAGCPLL